MLEVLTWSFCILSLASHFLLFTPTGNLRFSLWINWTRKNQDSGIPDTAGMGGNHGRRFKRISEILSVNCETSPNSFSSVSKMLITSHTPPSRRVKYSFLQNKPPASGVKSFRYGYLRLPNRKSQLATTSSSLKERHVLPTHTELSTCFSVLHY